MLGYHGCDRAVAEKLIAGDPFQPSDNDYDWLGHGSYFWESNPTRGLEFATELKARKNQIVAPYVVGAAIDLGYCLDLLSASGIQAVEAGHASFSQVMAASGSGRRTFRSASVIRFPSRECSVSQENSFLSWELRDQLAGCPGSIRSGSC